MSEALSVNKDQSKAEIATKLVKKDSDLKQLNMMYMQLATEKSALSREKMKLIEKLDKKRAKMQFTQKQFELTIKQFDQARSEKDQLLAVLQK